MESISQATAEQSRPNRGGARPDPDGSGRASREQAVRDCHVARLSLDQIAARLGLSRGQVAGVLYRLRRAGLLPARAPLSRERISAAPAAPKPPVSVVGVPVTLRPEDVIHAAVAPAAPPAPRATGAGTTLLPLTSAPLTTQAPAPYRRIVTCCWPIGEPGTRDFRFCDGTAVAGRSYCSDHAARSVQPAPAAEMRA